MMQGGKNKVSARGGRFPGGESQKSNSSRAPRSRKKLIMPAGAEKEIFLKNEFHHSYG